jgi:thiol-disulfide isomerase/thioredoxin
MKARRLTMMVAALTCGAARLSLAQDSGIPIGTQAPAAAVETLDGAPFDLSTYVGKGPVLLQFWATWCGNCKALEPQIEAAIQKYGAKMKFVAVAVSVNQSVARVKAYRDAHRMKQDIVYDHKGNAAGNYEAPATSFIVVVDASGKVVYTGVGADQNIEAAVRKALN